MAYLSTLTAPRADAADSFAGGLHALVARYKAWRSYRSTVTALAGLTDRELDDIGVTRGEIRHVARSAR